MIETNEFCDCCGADLHDLAWDGGVRVYRGKFRSFWKWHGHAEEPKGAVTVCGDCWRAIGVAVDEGRTAHASVGAGADTRKETT